MTILRLIQMTIGLLSACLISFWVWAHGGGHPTRYVAVNGVDSGECATPKTACATMSYAVKVSGKGDKILVSEGRYAVEELDIFYLLSDMVLLQGGYSLKDSYQRADSNKYLTVIEGIPAEYREKLAQRGFHLVRDAKGIAPQLSKREKALLQTYSKLTSQGSSAAACESGRAGNNDCHNIDLVAHMPLAQFNLRPSGANDIWGFVDLNNQREYALMGLRNGVSVVDVTDPVNPTEVGSVSGALNVWRDVKVYQFFDDGRQEYRAYAYVTTEANAGLQILDLNDLPNTVSLVTTFRDDFSSAHNVYLANVDYATGVALEGFQPYLYISGSNRNGGVFLTYSLENPVAPARVAEGRRTGSENDNSAYIHDATSLVIDDARTEDCAPGHNPCELLIDFNEKSIDIWDTTDKSNVVKISGTSYDQVGYVHSGWWSEDKQTIFVQDESDERDFGLNTTLRALDIRDLKNPTIRGVFSGTTRAIDHNGFTKGNYYYMSNYARGLTVIDVSDPANMREVGFFDTFAVPSQNDARFNGAWGTYPYLPSGTILVSDTEYGLWLLRLNENDGPIGTAPTAVARPPRSGGGSGTVGLSALVGLLLLLQFSRRR